MGAGIAQVSLDKGIHTILKDNFSSGLAKGQEQIYNGYDKFAKKKKITTYDSICMKILNFTCNVLLFFIIHQFST